MYRHLIVLTTIGLLCAVGSPADIIHVPGDRPTIQAGIDAAANGDTVLVADGTYTGPGNRDIDFKGKSILVSSETGREYCIIDCQDEGRGFYFHQGEDETALLRGFTIRNGYEDLGGGIICDGSSPRIESMLITQCEAEYDGGAIYCRDSSGVIDSTVIYQNRVAAESDLDGAGGIHCHSSSPLITNTIIMANTGVRGGGVHCEYESSPRLSNCLICFNTAFYWDYYYYGYEYGGWGGALYVSHPSSAPVIENSTLTGNDSTYSSAVYGLEGTITDSILWNEGREISGNPTVTYCNVEEGWDGEGNIDADPLFAEVVNYDYVWYRRSLTFFLSQEDAGQPGESPCVDAGSNTAAALGLDTRSTRTDFVSDEGRVDIGFHYPVPADEPETRFILFPYDWTGYVDSPVLIFIYTGEDDLDVPADLVFSWALDDSPWSQYSAATTTVITTAGLSGLMHRFRVRCRDTDGNVDPLPAAHTFFIEDRHSEHWDGLVTGPGPGPHNPPLVRTSEAQWLAYGVLRHGANVACGNLDGIGLDEVITGPGPGPRFGPHVRGWSIYGVPVSEVNFIAYGTRRFGVNVATGDIDNDGFDEIITAPGPGAVFGPHVRGWNYDGTGPVTPIEGVSYFAYRTPRWGVNVTAGDIDGDGYDEIVTGAGPGAVYGPHVRGWNYDGTGQIAPIQQISYFAYGTPRFGVNVACGDLDGDGYDEIITGAGPGSSFGAHVRAWNFDGDRITTMPGVSFFAYDSLFGVRVAAGDADGDGIDEILTITGPSPEQPGEAAIWSVDDGSVTRDRSFTAYDSWISHGGTIAGGHLN